MVGANKADSKVAPKDHRLCCVPTAKRLWSREEALWLMRGVVFIYGVDCVERAKVVDVHLVPGGDVIAWSVCNHVSSALIETWAADTPHRLYSQELSRAHCCMGAGHLRREDVRTRSYILYAYDVGVYLCRSPRCALRRWRCCRRCLRCLR